MLMPPKRCVASPNAAAGDVALVADGGASQARDGRIAIPRGTLDCRGSTGTITTLLPLELGGLTGHALVCRARKDARED
jgi:hypothetical protein